jgi:peptidyl-prolyl cis-trans isomerase C
VKAVYLIAVVGSVFGLGCGAAESGSEAIGAADENRKAEECPEPQGVPSERIVARICGRTLTVDDVQERLASKSRYLLERYRDPKNLREFVDDLVRFEVLLREAERRGFGQDPEVLRARESAMVGLFVREEFEDAPGTRISEVPDRAIEEYYRAHPDEFTQPERVRASHIQLADRRLAEQVLAQVLAAPSDAELFARLALEHSKDAETRSRSGDLRYFVRPAERRPGEPEVAREIAEAAFSLDRVGDVHPRLVQTPEGWHIVKLTGRREAWHRTLEEARSRIQSRLVRDRRRERIEAFAQEAGKRLGVEVNEEALELVRIPPGEARP